MENRSKVHNEEARTTPMTSIWCIYCLLWTYFTPFFGKLYIFATDACTSIIGNKKIAPRKKQKVKEQSIKTVSLCFLNWFQDIANVSSGKTESAKSRAWCACVLAFFASLRACVLTCFACFRAFLLACFRAWRACVLVCLRAWRAFVLACLT